MGATKDMMLEEFDEGVPVCENCGRSVPEARMIDPTLLFGVLCSSCRFDRAMAKDD